MSFFMIFSPVSSQVLDGLLAECGTVENVEQGNEWVRKLAHWRGHCYLLDWGQQGEVVSPNAFDVCFLWCLYTSLSDLCLSSLYICIVQSFREYILSGFLYRALVDLELTSQTRLALKSQRPACLCLGWWLPRLTLLCLNTCNKHWTDTVGVAHA